MSNKINVVAAVICVKEKYLVCQRPKHKRHGGLWEFPGGKVDLNETFENAIKRELFEELSINLINIGKVLYSTGETNSDFVIHFIESQILGKPKLNEHQKKRWATKEELLQLPFAPSDMKFIQQLR